MTDKELIYNYLDKHYKVDLSPNQVTFMMVDRDKSLRYNLHEFSELFDNIFGEYEIDYGVTSFSVMLDWFRERSGSIDNLYLLINKAKRINELINYKSMVKRNP